MCKTFRCFFLTFFVLLAFNSRVNAVPFGAFDPRSLAMGGAGVAAATSANAAYYNPALLAMFKTRKEIGRNSRFIFPTVTASAAEAVINEDNLDYEGLEQDLTDSITAFNNNMNSQTAQGVLDAATDLNNRLDQFVDGPVHVDVNSGMILGVGHKQEGGSIIINRRFVGTGAVENLSTDLVLLEDYVEAMQFIETGGVAGEPHPELFDPANGQLIDQTDNLTSVANGAALDVTEIGMAMSKQLQLFSLDIAIGVTPKILHVTTYDIEVRADTGAESETDQNEDWDVNMDLGLAHQINSQWRAGLVIKNLRSVTYTTSLGTDLKIERQVRAGVAYDSPWGLYAADIDVIENDPVAYGSPSQMLAFGGEWRLKRWFQLRAGINKNMKGIGNNSDPLFSGGFRWDFGGILDITYARGSAQEAVGLQLGYRF